MRYLIIEYETEASAIHISDRIKEILEKEFIETKVSFIGSYPDRESAQCCSVIRERLMDLEKEKK